MMILNSLLIVIPRLYLIKVITKHAKHALFIYLSFFYTDCKLEKIRSN